MTRPITSLVAALAISLAIALASVLSIVLSLGSMVSDGIGVYAGGVGEVFLLLLAAGLVLTFVVLLVLFRKSRC